jgi:PIN domain nuclease of toxin-antitoxin system
VKLLLDTHTFLWQATADARLSAVAASLLTDSTNELFISMASLWEIAIKAGLGKLVLTAPFLAFVNTAINGYGDN